MPLWVQIVCAVAAAIWPAGLYVGAKLSKVDALLEGKVLDRLLVLETKEKMREECEKS